MFRFALCFSVVLLLVAPARGQITAADADFDGSGVVDFADFILFVNVFGQTVHRTTGSIEGDRAALVAFDKATWGYQWTYSRNWLSDRPLNEWHGVNTNEQGRVITLSLYDNQLSGRIPPELGNLSNLEWLNLLDNQIFGSIPPELGNLSKLTFLMLFGNQLSGAIPPELSNLSKLTNLSLDYNQLTGAIPPELGNLANLESLGLRQNQLTGAIPPELGTLSNLKGLYLGKNQLTGPIPSELGNLSNLESLDLSSNQLSGPIPPELGNLTNLESLDLSNNPDLCMPSALSGWKFYNTEGVSKCSE